MSRENNEKPPLFRFGSFSPSHVIAAILGLALIYGIFALFGNGGNGFDNGGNGMDVRPTISGGSSLKTHVRGEMKSFAVHDRPRALPDFAYIDEKGATHSLKELRGKVALLNLWATWCGPCRREMPWLDDLQKRMGGPDFEVLTISLDRGGLEKPRRFFDKAGVRHLVLYGDPTGRLGAKLRAFAMPTSLLLDRKGRELGRLAGGARWSGKDAMALIKAAIAAK
jgi:thiol-disulfide isomerase/thioredoxin